jgi:hypothetical protein
VLSKVSDKFIKWHCLVFLFHFSQCPIDAQGIELHIEKKAGCSEKKGREVPMPPDFNRKDKNGLCCY